jgi:hypothetical protein
MRRILVICVLSLLAMLPVYSLASRIFFKDAPEITSAEPTSRCTRMAYPKKSKNSEKTQPGTRCARMFAKHAKTKGNMLPNQAPSLDLRVSPLAGSMATIHAVASDADGDSLLYTYSSTGGRLSGDGPEAKLDLSGVAPGSYTVSAEIDDGCGCITFDSVTVTAE